MAAFEFDCGTGKRTIRAKDRHAAARVLFNNIDERRLVWIDSRTLKVTGNPGHEATYRITQLKKES